MTFSVILASYNYENLVLETLASLVAQTFRDFEIVVVDDGSTDGSVPNIRHFIDRHCETDVPIRLLMHPDGGNHGLPATVKLGVQESHGKYVAFCESDDLWTPNHLAEVAKVVDATRGAAVLIANDVEIFGDPDRAEKFGRVRDSRRSRLKDGLNSISPRTFRDANFILTFSAACARRDILASCDFNPAGRPAALDWWLWRQIAYDKPLYYVDKRLTKWRMHSSLMSGSGAVDGMSDELSLRHAEFTAAGNALLRRKHPFSAWWRLLGSASTARPGIGKWVRGKVKRLMPYAMQRSYAYKTYGIFFPAFGPFWSLLPFGLVCMLKRMDPDNGVGAGVVHSPLLGLFGPRYRLDGSRRRRFFEDREKGLVECRAAIERNAGARILVILHLFYPESWPIVKVYLENLAPYRFDLVVTVIEGECPEKTKESIRSFAKTARIVPCANRGFDIGPFVHVLKDADLESYDIVFKLHSKGIRRPSIFIYGQLFKHDDWFFNLFDGVLDGKVVHQIIDALLNAGARLCAADNLIVSDPPHKQRFVKSFCEARGIEYVENYRFVAGTCFATKAETLKPLKEMDFGVDDFAPVERGVFSVAHAVERVMCFPAIGATMGFPVRRNLYPEETAAYLESSPLRLLDDSRFIIDDEFFYRVLETRHVKGYEVVRIRLGDIHRKRNDGSLCALEACEPFLFLRGDAFAYESYCQDNRQTTGFAMSPERFESLRREMRTYDPRRMPVVRGKDNVLMDGQHRCCILLDQYGPDHEIDVLRIW